MRMLCKTSGISFDRQEIIAQMHEAFPCLYYSEYNILSGFDQQKDQKKDGDRRACEEGG
jgi:hypothetical protein